jgi:hypothetical protein
MEHDDFDTQEHVAAETPSNDSTSPQGKLAVEMPAWSVSASNTMTSFVPSEENVAEYRVGVGGSSSEERTVMFFTPFS